MYEAMISEIAKNKLENFKPSFDEINKKIENIRQQVRIK